MARKIEMPNKIRVEIRDISAVITEQLQAQQQYLLEQADAVETAIALLMTASSMSYQGARTLVIRKLLKL